MKNAPC
jgi:hypothetical protein